MPEIATNTVLIMYPDCRTTRGLPLLDGEEPQSLFGGQFRATVGKILRRYQRQGYENLAVIYADTTPLTYSPLYPFDKFNRLMSMGRTFKGWNREDHTKDLEKLVKELSCPEGSRFVVGGYHAKDCVVEMVKTLRSLGYKATPNLLLTNILGEFLLMSHYERKVLGKVFDKEDRNWNRMIYGTIKEDIE